ncbi:hypothetical protein ACFRFU_44165 [Streptomyces sp. NPDC056704]|uniref:hypothetical protein n=1 Tax=Streptomyces sp. NPDC056704 TaxID=3345917 RepID=UPI0036CD4EF4
MTQHCAGRSCARCGLRRQRTPEGWLYKVSVPAWANTDGRVEPAWYTVWVQAPAHVKRTPGTLLSTACFVIVSYLSGARPGEVLNLRRGCVEHDTASELWLMTGRHYKNAVDADGNKLPAGAPRRDPWVVIAPVARAVAALERLHPHPLLFPNRVTPHQQHLRDIKRRGEARTDGQIARDLAAFVT